MNENILISVIMPTYNHAVYLRDAIQSVLEQSYQQLELIIVDNFSEDDTQSIVSALHDPRVKYYRYHNKGIIAAARNYGVEKSSGQLLAFIDSDDIWQNEKLQFQVAYIHNNHVAGVATNFIPIGQVYYAYKTLRFKPSEDYKDLNYEDLILSNPVPASSYLVKREDFIKVGGFDENASLMCIEDWDLWLRISRLGSIRVLAKELIKYRIIKNKDRDFQHVSRLTLKLLESHYMRGYMTKKLYNQSFGNCCLSISKCCLDANNHQGIRFCLRALFHSAGSKNKLKSIFFMLLFLLPVTLKDTIVDKLYKARYFFQTK